MVIPGRDSLTSQLGYLIFVTNLDLEVRLNKLKRKELMVLVFHLIFPPLFLSFALILLFFTFT